MDMEKASFNALSIALEANYKKLAKLFSQHNSWQKAWKAYLEKYNDGPDIEAEWDRLLNNGINLLLATDQDFPPLLHEIPWPPLALYIKGSLEGYDKALAIVGTRRATPDAKTQAKKFAAECSRKGLAIISGLALGVDAAAHEGCLEAKGKTIAVLGNGLDSIYPKTNWQLAERILTSGGAIVSEYPPGTPPLPHHFLERNRIVSGLSNGVLIIEAPEASGTLATARFATDQNRDIFVLPGPVGHPNFTGSHGLIRQGAELVTEPEHILGSFDLSSTPNQKKYEPENAEEKSVLESIYLNGPELEIDKIVELTNLNAQIINRTVTLLLLKNALEECQGGYRIRL